MGMYNEVFKQCPECGKYGYMQIPQIVLGFGNFYLDDITTLRDLSNEDLLQLKEYVKDGNFRCECGNFFNVYEKDTNGKDQFIKQLFME